ncbi:MAG: GGDEF domain-containing protein [Synergistaceae bacterium]|nr:GGDEF domain-containing protein [Synergistaceae bacterium]
MTNNEINIYVQDKTLIPDVKKILRGEFSYNFHSHYPSKIDPNALNIFIARDFPARVSDSSTEREYQKRLVEMAHQDYLTGLATRWYLQEYVQNNQHEENITCIYFDLDNFKYVNDTYGHQAGDRALAATAEMMQREFADGLVARMGGDEFMVVLPGAKTLAEVETRVNTFMKNLLDYYKTMPTMTKLSVSAGIAQKINGSDKTIDTLIHESDTALYAAKKSGKNCCRIYCND